MYIRTTSTTTTTTKTFCIARFPLLFALPHLSLDIDCLLSLLSLLHCFAPCAPDGPCFFSRSSFSPGGSRAHRKWSVRNAPPLPLDHAPLIESIPCARVGEPELYTQYSHTKDRQLFAANCCYFLPLFLFLFLLLSRYWLLYYVLYIIQFLVLFSFCFVPSFCGRFLLLFFCCCFKAEFIIFIIATFFSSSLLC